MVSEGLCTAQARIAWADRIGGSEHRQGWAQPEDDEETRLEPGLLVEALAALFL